MKFTEPDPTNPLGISDAAANALMQGIKTGQVQLHLILGFMQVACRNFSPGPEIQAKWAARQTDKLLEETPEALTQLFNATTTILGFLGAIKVIDMRAKGETP